MGNEWIEKETGESSLAEAQLHALNRVVAIAEFAPDGLLVRANHIYRTIFGLDNTQATGFGLDSDQVAGRHHRSFCTPHFVNSDDYTLFWQKLTSGHPYSGLAERVRQDGSICWLEATYTPVFNPQGQLQQILKVATDITHRKHLEQAQQEHLRMLSLVADASDTAIMISDSNSRIIYTNRGFSRMFGWRSEEVIGQSPIFLLAPSKTDEFVEAYRAKLRTGDPIAIEDIVSTKDGQRYWAKVISNPVLDTAQQWRYTVTLLTDITNTKLYEVLQHRALEAMAREKPLSEILETICQEVERIAPELLVSILAVDEENCLRPLAAPSLPPDFSNALDGVPIGPAVGSCGTAAWHNEAVRCDDIASDLRWANFRHLTQPLNIKGCWSTPFCNSDGKVIGTFGFYFRTPRNQAAEQFHLRLVEACTHLCTLALERESARQRIRKLAFYDGLTGLPNRSLLQAKADQAIASASRNQEPLAVIFIDLDRFKQVNDSLGHPAGDELLRQVAQRLKQDLRTSDIASRLSGDEFVIILPQCSSTQATDTVERIQALLSAPVMLDNTSVAISSSVGVAMFPDDGRTIETLLHRADMAMYQAKNSGRNQFRFFSREMNRLAQERLMLENALRHALANNLLHLHYQPQIETATGQLYGIEALARWTHPELGVISPARFIPLAEECGLIVDLGHWVLREACKQLARWRSTGLLIPSIAVNLSTTSFHNLDLPNTIATILEHNALNAADLTVEITESILLDTNPSTLKTIADVHAQGIRLSMDDFGTGYSSLSYLRKLPVSELKLDRSFVADLEHDEAARALSRAILGIGQSLQLTLVAEGVETETQNLMLKEQGYPVAQGYFFSRPQAPEALEQWLREQLI